MRKHNGPNTEPCGISALQSFNWRTGHLRQLFDVYYGEMTQLDQKGYHSLHSVSFLALLNSGILYL